MKKVLKTLIQLSLNMVIAIFMAMVLILISIALGFDISTKAFSYLLFVVIFVAIMSSYYRGWLKSAKLISIGKLDEAIKYLLKLHKRYENTIGYKSQALYNMAICYNFKGEFIKSLSILDKMKGQKLDKKLEAAYLGLYASNLIAIEKDPEIAEDYLDQAIEKLNLPIFLLSKAHVRLIQGDRNTAEHLVNKVVDFQPKKFIFGIWSVFIIDRKLDDLLQNFLLGMYYYKIKNIYPAKRYFREACKYKYDNYYSNKANEILEVLG